MEKASDTVVPVASDDNLTDGITSAPDLLTPDMKSCTVCRRDPFSVIYLVANQ